MCGSCGFPAVPGHWTDAGMSGASDRLRTRDRRAKILNRVLSRYGLKAHDGLLVPGLQISSLSGEHVLVQDLAQAWKEAERMAGAAIDPLDQRFLNADAGPGQG
jgi:hypothetical protein